VFVIIKKKELGNIGEDISSKYLEQIGYEIIERNFICRQGEIDIIAKDKDEYVFIEVKTRSNVCFGRPREAVNTDKQKHIYKATKYYLHIHNLDNCFVRFDVIEIYLKRNKYRLNHLKQVDINVTI
jgi:putative endonuclease